MVRFDETAKEGEEIDMTAKELSSAPAPLAYSEPEQLVQDFASRGRVVLAPESLGIPAAFHERIYQREKQAVGAGERVTPELIPDVLEVINALGVGRALIPACLEALVQSLGREGNRLAMDRAQGRSIKFVRPTDECDVCEGGGVDFGFEQFKPVRSAVRENALWSMVILCSHGTAIAGPALKPTTQAFQEIIRSDENAICVGFAMDALGRLAHLRPDGKTASDLQAEVSTLLAESPMRCWESLARSGLCPA